jgi:putative ABC transport system ATP-binding protein
MLLEIRDLIHRRGRGGHSFTVEIPRLELTAGELVSVTGESGSGKSTVLELLGLVAQPNHCTRFLWETEPSARVDVAALWRGRGEAVLARLRASRLGFVLQTGGLLPYLTVAGNIQINRRLLRLPPRDPELEEILDRLEIRPLLDKKPGELSVGQHQRAAIGRALAHRPALLLADEPTSALDPRLADSVIELLIDLVERLGTTAVLATHEQHRARALHLREIRATPRSGGPGYGSVFVG